MQAQEIVDYVFSIAPNPSFATENIYEFGDGAREVTGIGIAWWLTSAMMEDMAANGLNLGLTHERVIYDLPEFYPWGQVITTDEIATNRRIAAITSKHSLTIHRFHSNLDLASWGMGQAVLEQLGWSDYPTDWSRGVPVVTIPPTSFRELIEHVKRRLALPFARYDGDLERVITRVAVPWGGMCQWWSGPACAVPIGFDAIIGGDVIDGVVRLAREENWAIIDALHHATEMGGMVRLAAKLRERFPEVPIKYYENSMPWSVL